MSIHVHVYVCMYMYMCVCTCMCWVQPGVAEHDVLVQVAVCGDASLH